MRTITIAILLAGCFAAAQEAPAQRSQAYAMGMSLGNMLRGTPSPIVPLGEDRLAVVSPTITSVNVSVLNLVVVETAIDAPVAHYIPVALPAVVEAKYVWAEPIVLDPRRLVLPTPGADAAYGTSDDVLVVFDGLDLPLTATHQSIPLGTAGPAFGTQVLRFSATSVGWSDPGLDGVWATGDEFVRVVENIGPAQFVHDIATNQPIGPRSVRLDDSAVYYSSPGADRVQGTPDDTLVVVETTADGSLQCKSRGFGLPIARPILGAAWPVPVGGRKVAFPSDGPDARFGSADDVFVICDAETGGISRQVTLGGAAWNLNVGPGGVAVEADGTVVMPAFGPDGRFGSADDQLLFVGPAGFVSQVASPGVMLTPLGGPWSPPAPVGLADGTVLFAHTGATGAAIDSGVVVVRRAPGGGRVVQVDVLNEAVREITPIGAGAAAIGLESGTMIGGLKLDGPSPIYEVLGGILNPYESRTVVLNPGMVLSTRGVDAGGGFYDDEILVWRPRSVWSWGPSTANDQGYTMRLEGDGTVPYVGGPVFYLQLQGAPANSSGYVLLGTLRGSFMPTTDAEVLLAFEGILPPIYWITFGDGSTIVPIIPPTDPAFAGFAAHAQILVYNPLAPRAYELSNAVSMMF